MSPVRVRARAPLDSYSASWKSRVAPPPNVAHLTRHGPCVASDVDDPLLERTKFRRLLPAPAGSVTAINPVAFAVREEAAAVRMGS
jgi:hypothetical protein